MGWRIIAFARRRWVQAASFRAQAVGEVGVGTGAEGEVEGGADEQGAGQLDAVLGVEQGEQSVGGRRGAVLQAGGGVGEGLLAQLAELVLKILVVAEPAVQGALGDAGLAGGGGDRAGAEQGGEGALLGGRQTVVIGFDGEGQFWHDLAVFGIVFYGFLPPSSGFPLIAAASLARGVKDFGVVLGVCC